eukprot:7899270-Alexandrium_andersonii.AAC.1
MHAQPEHPSCAIPSVILSFPSCTLGMLVLLGFSSISMGGALPALKMLFPCGCTTTALAHPASDNDEEGNPR